MLLVFHNEVRFTMKMTEVDVGTVECLQLVMCVTRMNWRAPGAYTQQHHSHTDQLMWLSKTHLAVARGANTNTLYVSDAEQHLQYRQAPGVSFSSCYVRLPSRQICFIDH